MRVLPKSLALNWSLYQVGAKNLKRYRARPQNSEKPEKSILISAFTKNMVKKKKKKEHSKTLELFDLEQKAWHQ